MRLFKKYGIDIILVTVVFVLLILLFIPWGFPALSENSKDAVLTKKVTTVHIEDKLNENNNNSVAGLFGARPVIVSNTSPGPVKPQITTDMTPSWIQYNGRVQKENGVTLYFFKNKRTNRMIELNPDGSRNATGWSLIEITSNVYVLNDGTQEYHVEK